ncbi:MULTISPECIES: undecaprenyldiphospho-muramoylpentapeptide beta-N-acetylglucosaminyltransferase [unclassified Paenibacillus]|uniref:undecaprenyldiphospho-muramoylpentapeptide beta-N-acetylglucosaminyltransferase n=1 Tax=unclassified Paenibacillus TaxID=185978 RepID=UPI001AE589B3|nr:MULTISPECIES: undecaprenyldiphospho-muramoylpentapeptide beta-N-acetylglucosaminyltransferase [unclassified Paenibacillus]MBP1156277.1 UDP-N-acetylglucosamine--N-acetylmuramyl-(pentapeptide) pyrophosphoryl-undecaprenol N-acetylglucosamine transferase [Paenibacillus sp. PvP091]MBP1168337.1 UDP-N-acetylglucosamine--N-acetylmuramyl-(pentapeptide) pyrophosphoryl-undecaprenol N-acetylglucosamine transferase [Paenibacillus sp. PvR098]MBP2439365.1 UDP-N-acetylglucosamine--N-acetylmuramyl-(pentapepti
MKKIVFTGGGTAGHVTPNLAIMAQLRTQGWEIEYIGSRDGIEKEIIDHEGIPFHHIASGKLRRYFDLKNAKDPFKVLLGVGQAYRLLRQIKPHIVFSKGGFVTVPVILACRLHGIPIICHESDLTPGLANKISMPFSSRICVTFPETLEHIRSDKAECTGLPIREQILQGNSSRGMQMCGFHSQKPVLLFMGGSLGAKKINQAVRESLDPLLAGFQIIHICGKGNTESALNEVMGYRQFEYVKDELPDLLACADLVISRAGSTSIFELLALRKPMLLIPLSREASRGDQILNAESFRKMGYSKVLYEEDLSPQSLVSGVSDLYEERARMKEQMSRNPFGNGTERIVQLIEACRLPEA